MKPFIFATGITLAASALAAAAQALPRAPVDSSIGTSPSIEAPEGTRLRPDGRLELLSGYSVQRLSSSRMAIGRAGRGGLGITATVHCNCSCFDTNVCTGSGTCSISTIGNILVCLNGTCSGGCEMETTIEGFRAAYIAAADPAEVPDGPYAVCETLL